LQRPGLGSSDDSPGYRLGRACDNAFKRVDLSELDGPYPVSATVARFVDRLAALSTEQWDAIQITIGGGGVEVTMIEASRNAAVALAVRDLISRAQFDHLYRPFKLAIPLESLDVPPTLD
jgi:hypothetical protein